MSKMFRQSNRRNQRNKGINITNAVHIGLLLAAVFWLLYQINHSHDRLTEYEEADQNMLDMQEGNVDLGRKAQAGLVNRISTVTDKSSETEGSVTDDALDSNANEKEQEESLNKEDKESQEGNGDDHAVSHVDGDVTKDMNVSKQTKKLQQFPSETDDSSSILMKEIMGIDVSDEENHLDENVKTQLNSKLDAKHVNREAKRSDEANISNNTTDGSETSERLSKHDDSATPILTEGIFNSTSFDNQENTKMLTQDEANKSEASESQGGTTSDDDFIGNSSTVGATAELRSDGQQENNVAFTKNEAPEKESVEQSDNTSESEVVDNHTGEAENSGTRSSVELSDSSITKEESHRVYEITTVEAQVTGTSGAEFATNHSSEVAKIEMAASMDVPKGDNSVKREVIESQGSSESAAQVTSKSANELENPLRASNELVQSEVVGSQDDGTLEAIETDNRSIEETNDETSSVDEAANFSKPHDISDVHDGAVESQGNSVFATQSTATSAHEDAKLGLISNKGTAKIVQEAGVESKIHSSAEVSRQAEYIDIKQSQ